MFIFVFGTTAELFKIHPIIQRLNGDDVQLWCTGQQLNELERDPTFLAHVGSSDLVWTARGVRGSSLTSILHVPIWLLKNFLWFCRNYRRARRKVRETKSVLVVHGDTMTTVLGAVFGKFLRIPVAHVEAGLRSGDWRNPFPEELDRRIVGKLAYFHFAPDDVACKNLRGARGKIIKTSGNTIVDTLSKSPTQTSDEQVLVLLHRTELLKNSRLLQETYKVILAKYKGFPVLIVRDALAESSSEFLHHLINERDAGGVRLSGKIPHDEFVAELLRSRLVITDSGGVQEECAALGIPCVVHRQTSERRDGLSDDGNAILSGLTIRGLTDALESPPTRRQRNLSELSPSDQIVDYLTSYVSTVK